MQRSVVTDPARNFQVTRKTGSRISTCSDRPGAIAERTAGGALAGEIILTMPAIPETTSAKPFAGYVGGKLARMSEGRAWREVRAWVT